MITDAMRKVVMDYISQNPGCLVRDIERATGVTGTSLHQLMGVLARSGAAIYTATKPKKWRLM